MPSVVPLPRDAQRKIKDKRHAIICEQPTEIRER